MAKDILSYTERYSRQQLIPSWDQEKIQNGKAIIGGIGALGTVIATNLAMIGIGELVLIDMDTIELSNLSRQLLFRKEHIGKYKSEIAAQELLKINPDVKITPFVGRVQKTPEKLFLQNSKQKVVILEGFDNFDARRWINSRAIFENIPLVSGGMYGMLGNVQVVFPGETACLDCQPLIPEKQLQKACTLPGKERKKQDSPNNNYLPAIASVSTVIGGIMTQEALKVIIGKKDSVIRDYLFWDGMSETFQRVPLSRRDDCVSCSETYKLKGVSFHASPKETFKQFYERLRLTFLAKEPEVIIDAKTVPLTLKNADIRMQELVDNNNIIFVTDEELATPLKIKIKFTVD